MLLDLLKMGLNLRGPFELHIVIELADEPLLQKWLLRLDDGALVSPKLTGFCAFYGDHPIHLMLSCFLNGPVEVVEEKTQSIVDSFQEHKIRVLRVKLEASLHAEGVPLRIIGGGDYYEVHLKVKVKSLTEWDALAAMSKPFDGHLFINNRSKSKGTHAIVTVRKYNTDLEAFEAGFTALDSLISKRFDIVSVRSEFSFYDTNPMLDHGWLFQ
jgi:hypothetical protein